MLEITGLAESTLIYTAEGYPDPGEPRVIPRLQDLIARPYRLDGSVPDTLQYLISEEQEEQDLRQGPITRSMALPPPSTTPPTPYCGTSYR